MEANPSSCADPILVKMPIVGRIISCNFSISATVEIPASKIPKLCWLLIPKIESGTPI